MGRPAGAPSANSMTCELNVTSVAALGFSVRRFVVLVRRRVPDPRCAMVAEVTALHDRPEPVSSFVTQVRASTTAVMVVLEMADALCRLGTCWIVVPSAKLTT